MASFLQIGSARMAASSRPHPSLVVEVDGEVWQVDLGNPNQTRRSGFAQGSAEAGDEITILGNRSLDESENLIKAVRITIDGQNYDMYSSLSRLHALPLTKIKIDRSFVTDLHLKPASFKIVKSLLALSRDMGLDCVVEGVETAEEIAILRKLGSLMVQGYYYSSPITEAEIAGFLGQRNAAS